MTMQQDGYTFILSGEVSRTPVRYKNRYGIEIAAETCTGRKTSMNPSRIQPSSSGRHTAG